MGKLIEDGGGMWRYKLVAMRAPLGGDVGIKAWEARLNELGSEGWEVVAVIEQPDGWCVFLKMPHEVGTY
jgi:hypothetical protein